MSQEFKLICDGCGASQAQNPVTLMRGIADTYPRDKWTRISIETRIGIVCLDFCPDCSTGIRQMAKNLSKPRGNWPKEADQ